MCTNSFSINLFSENNQHKYTHKGYKKQMRLYITNRYNTYINTLTLIYKTFIIIYYFFIIPFDVIFNQTHA